MSGANRDRESGQALVEAALTLPVMLFCILGALQLFLLLQARLIAEYAVYRAVRAGSLNHGDCRAMTHAAVLSVLPAITRTDGPEPLAAAWELRRSNRYDARADTHDGQIIELWREQPRAASVAAPEDLAFDQPSSGNVDHLVRIEARMVFWVRLKIPFVDWLLARAFLAYWGLKPYDAVNPLMPVQTVTASWQAQSRPPRWPGGDLGEQMLRWAEQGRYLFPIQTQFGMRMMTPAKKQYWPGAMQGCPL
ncbi:MAG: pilus assembly protein [Myxococcaceae bacterium]|nr:pilus assembly protein [Myxococcaceae bacterium]